MQSFLPETMGVRLRSLGTAQPESLPSGWSWVPGHGMYPYGQWLRLAAGHPPTSTEPSAAAGFLRARPAVLSRLTSSAAATCYTGRILPGRFARKAGRPESRRHSWCRPHPLAGQAAARLLNGQGFLINSGLNAASSVTDVVGQLVCCQVSKTRNRLSSTAMGEHAPCTPRLQPLLLLLQSTRRRRIAQAGKLGGS